MTSPTYSFRNGSRVRGGVDPQTVGQELQRIRDAHDGITPKLLVSEAANPTSPIHPCFTWDDTEAADRWRQEEARYLVKSVRVLWPDSDTDEPAFIHVESSDAKHSHFSFYESTRLAVQHFSLYESAWRTARREVDSALRAMNELERIASEHLTDANVARAETTSQAVQLARQASALLDQAH